jgi:hypothetical protein
VFVEAAVGTVERILLTPRETAIEVAMNRSDPEKLITLRDIRLAQLVPQSHSL